MSDPPVDGESTDESQPLNRAPEDVVRTFVDRLSMGDTTGTYDLYHSNASMSRVYWKDLVRLKQGKSRLLRVQVSLRELSSSCA